jgi:hypothetical protein
MLTFVALSLRSSHLLALQSARRAPNSWSAAASSAPQSIEQNKAAFDFESSNARFEKVVVPVAEADASATPLAADSAVPSYDLPSADASGIDPVSGFPIVVSKYNAKKSFFDELTSDSRSGPSAQTFDRREMRRTDVDTFGNEAADFRSKHNTRGGRGGGQRGGRGGRQGQGQSNGGGWRGQPAQ